jgi:hypothetical protein
MDLAFATKFRSERQVYNASNYYFLNHAFSTKFSSKCQGLTALAQGTAHHSNVNSDRYMVKSI